MALRVSTQLMQRKNLLLILKNLFDSIDMSKEYKTPVISVVSFVHHGVICGSFDRNNMTEILLTEDEETI